jgi:hypothetical protein
VRRSEGWIHGRDSSVGIATSYRLDGPRSISRYFQFFIPSVFLCITYLRINAFCITVTHSVLLMYYSLRIVHFYVTVPPGIGPIAVRNKYNLKVGCLHPVACTRSGSGFPSNATLV